MRGCCNPARTARVLFTTTGSRGTRDACARKLREVYEKTGGFGHVLMLVYDWESRQKLLRSSELFAKAVMPRLADPA